MPSTLLTQKLVNQYACPTGLKKSTLFDTKVKRLFIEARISGTKTYSLRYANKRGKTCQIKLGCSSAISLADARLLALKKKNEVAMGSDPLAAKQDLQQILTFAQLVDMYYLPHAQLHKKSWRGDVGNLNNHILPILGKKYVDEISREDIERVVQTRVDKGGAKGSANLSLILIRHIFNLAFKVWRVAGITFNPSEGIPMLKVNNCRDRFLQPHEVTRLNTALQNSKCAMLKYIVGTLLLTGARKNEALQAQWQDIDFSRGQWRIPQAKSGRVRYILLSQGVIDLFRSLQALQLSTRYVFPNPKTRLPYRSISQPWSTARIAANLEKVRLHDLRHTFASILINGGRSLYEVQALLGHTNSKTTQRYAHLEARTLQDATSVAVNSVGHLLDCIPTTYPQTKQSHRTATTQLG